MVSTVFDDFVTAVLYAVYININANFSGDDLASFFNSAHSSTISSALGLFFSGFTVTKNTALS